MTHYYSEKQDSELKLYTIEIDLGGRKVELISASGVFSAKKLDRGTELLLNNLEKWDRVLDLGCGWGTIGVLYALSYPDSQVVMSDVNKRAVKIARMNIRKHDLSNAKALNSDKFEKIEGSFDAILLNPPQTAGKQVCFDMIEGSKDYLNTGGELRIVARHNKGGKHLSEKMKEVFGNVTEIAKKGGFRVYNSNNNGSPQN